MKSKKRRTKKQKVAARASFVYKLSKEKNKTNTKVKPNSLFAYDTGLIRSDLTKTLILSILAVATIVAIFYIKY